MGHVTTAGSNYAFEWKKSDCNGCTPPTKQKKEGEDNNTSTTTTDTSPKKGSLPPCEEVKDEVESVIIASEPLYRTAEVWNLVPNNHVVIVTPNHQVILEPINLETVCTDETDAAHKTPSFENLDDVDASEKCRQQRKRKKIRPKSALSVMACGSSASSVSTSVSTTGQREKIPFCSWGIDNGEGKQQKQAQVLRKSVSMKDTTTTITSTTFIASRGRNSPTISPNNSSPNIPTRAALKASSPVTSPRQLSTVAPDPNWPKVADRQQRLQDALQQASPDKSCPTTTSPTQPQQPQQITAYQTHAGAQAATSNKAKKHKKKKKTKHTDKNEVAHCAKRPAAVVVKLGSMPFFLATILFNLLLIIAVYYCFTSIVKA